MTTGRTAGSTITISGTIVATFLATAQMVSAESVMVNASESGQGYLVSHRGNCYVVTAAHVVGEGRRAQVITAAGDEATATIQRPFWEGFDVAVGVLRTAPRTGCGPTSSQLASDMGRPSPGRISTLPFVARGGSISVPIRVERVDYLELTGRIDDSQQEAKKGMSGGFLLLDGKPLGMARAVEPDGTLRFVRIEEIEMNLSRWFNQSGFTGEAEFGQIMPEQAAADGAARLELVSSSPLSINVDHTADLMLAGEGVWIPEAGKSADLVVRNLTADGSAPTLSRLWLGAETGDSFAAPKSYRIDVAATDAQEPKWRLYAVGEIHPDGSLDTGQKAKIRANLIRIQVLSTWGEGQIGIKSLRIE